MPQNTKAGDASGRPTRTIKKSAKAQEIEDSGEVVPGIPSPDQDNRLTSLTSSLLTSSPATINTPGAVASMPASAARARNLETKMLKVLGPDKYGIYFWPVPRPQDFPHISDSQKAWKRRMDEEEGAAYFDDGAEDWYEYGDLGNDWYVDLIDRKRFRDSIRHPAVLWDVSSIAAKLETLADSFSSDGYRYEPIGKDDGVSAVRCIASSFKNRAKLAFRQGKSWDEFEDQEQRAYSEPIARARCPNGMVDVLSGRLRTDVWHAIRERLCNEIWLEEYSGPPGLVRLQVSVPQGRVDSAVPSPVGAGGPSGLGSAGTVQRRSRPPTAEEAERKIKGFTEMEDGTWQPFYEGETGAPVPVLEQLRGVRR